jgi:hypothetical protein
MTIWEWLIAATGAIALTVYTLERGWRRRFPFTPLFPLSARDRLIVIVCLLLSLALESFWWRIVNGPDYLTPNGYGMYAALSELPVVFATCLITDAVHRVRRRSRILSMPKPPV